MPRPAAASRGKQQKVVRVGKRPEALLSQQSNAANRCLRVTAMRGWLLSETLLVLLLANAVVRARGSGGVASSLANRRDCG